MKKIMGFYEYFVNEKAMDIEDPGKASSVFKDILVNNKGVSESPPKSNKGPEVNKYLGSVGLQPGLAWCAAFVYYVFNELSKKLGVTNPLPKTGGVADLWAKSEDSLKIKISDARANMDLVKPGQIFIIILKDGRGHTGIVLNVDKDKKEFVSIEGNTTGGGSREGGGVSVNKRSINQESLAGFIDYFKGERNEEFEKNLRAVADESVIKGSKISQSLEDPDPEVTGEEPKMDPAVEDTLSSLARLLGYEDFED